MPTHVVVLGAGFGGLGLSTRLCEQLGGEVRVTLIDQNDSFVFGFSKLDVLFGRRPLDELRLYYRDIVTAGVTFKKEMALSIDGAARRVVTDQATYDADILVIALGADLDPAATPGLVDDGYEFYSPGGLQRAGDALAGLDSGDIVIGVLGPRTVPQRRPAERGDAGHHRGWRAGRIPSLAPAANGSPAGPAHRRRRRLAHAAR